MEMPTSCAGDCDDIAFLSCHPGWRGFSREAAASESPMLLYVTPQNLLAHQTRHGYSHFLSL